MAEDKFPIGQWVNLPGHFPVPVVLEAVRPIASGYECRIIRLRSDSPEKCSFSR